MISARSAGEDSVIYYDEDGNITTEDAFDLTVETHVLYITDSPNYTTIRYFQNEIQLEQFANQSPSDSLRILPKLRALAILRAYAELHLEEEFYDATGDFSVGFKDLIDSFSFGENKPSGLFSTLYDNLSGSGPLTGLATFPIPTFGGNNDKSEAASGTGGYVLFDRTIWRGASRYIFLIPAVLKRFDGERI